MKKFFFVGLIFLSEATYAQRFVAEAALPPVTQNGFYRLAISPEMIGYTKSDFSNLRIYDDKNKEVPYLLSEESPVFSTSQFVEYPLLENSHEPGCCTELVISNKNRKPLTNVSLVIRNAETFKSATLRGSDDQKKWYALKERFYLNAIRGVGETYEVRIVDFPLSNYAYLSITINDSTTAPLNVIKAGYYDTNEVVGHYTEIQPARLLTLPSTSAQKETTLVISFDGERLVDKLDFTLTGPKFYYRNASVFVPRTMLDLKNKRIKRNVLISEAEFTSTHQTSLNFPAVKTSEFIIKVQNEDNPELNFKSVKAYQLNRYMVALLSPDMRYSIKIGNDSTVAPRYDLQYFRDSIPLSPPQVHHGKLNVIKRSEPAKESTTFFTSKIFIWSAIIVVISVLAFMSIKMVKETSGKA
jgi:hypothetical protein